jgi:predicted  nucleic acid-binding Zn-ribbon protein
VKADPFVQLRLLELQGLDSTLDRLRHRRRTLPELAEMARLDGLVDALRDGVVRAETEVSDLAREQARFEKEIEQVRARRDRDESRLASGAITASKQLQDLEREVASLKRRQAELEDAELEVMERAETAQAGLSELTSRREAHLADRAKAEAAAEAAFVEIDAEIETTSRARDELAATMPADLLALYEKIRASEGGVGAGEIARGRCGGCHLDLMNNEKSAFRTAPPDEVLRHEECNRILVRTAESGL